MTLKNCSWCGKVFVHPSDNVCPSCRQEEEEDFEKVYTFLKTKRSANVDAAHEATGVDRRRIIKFIRTGRLVSDSGAFEIYAECENCGDPILEGRYCETCTKTLQDEVQAIKQLNKEKDKDKEKTKKERKAQERMHYANRKKRKEKK